MAVHAEVAKLDETDQVGSRCYRQFDLSLQMKTHPLSQKAVGANFKDMVDCLVHRHPFQSSSTGVILIYAFNVLIFPTKL